MCEQLHENQKSQEKELSGLRSFARQVEQFLARLKAGATAPRESCETPLLEKGGTSESLGAVSLTEEELFVRLNEPLEMEYHAEAAPAAMPPPTPLSGSNPELLAHNVGPKE